MSAPAVESYLTHTHLATVEMLAHEPDTEAFNAARRRLVFLHLEFLLPHLEQAGVAELGFTVSGQGKMWYLGARMADEKVEACVEDRFFWGWEDDTEDAEFIEALLDSWQQWDSLLLNALPLALIENHCLCSEGEINYSMTTAAIRDALAEDEAALFPSSETQEELF